MRHLAFFLSFLIGYTFAALEVPEHFKDPAKIMHDACQAETGAAEEIIQSTRNGYVPDDPKLKCYILCLLEHAGMIEEDGTIHHEKVRHLMPPSIEETFDRVVQLCATKHGDTRCETAYLTLKCYFEAAPEGSMIP